MDNALMMEVLAEAGWDRKFAIPVLNAENKALAEEIQRKQKELTNVQNDAVHQKEKSSAMAEHLKNVEQEIIYIQALCRAVEKQTDSELHFKALADREIGWLQHEISKLQNEQKTLLEKKNSNETFIFKAKQNLEEFKTQMNWDQQTLDAWLEESARKDEDIMTIVKYAKQDDSRIRELTLTVEKLTHEENQKRNALDKELTETIMIQVALEKTVEMLQQAHFERQELIRQWENAIKQMKKKDRDMEHCSLLQVEANLAIRERKELIKEQQSYLANLVENNKECEKKIAAVERQARRQLEQFQEKENNCVRMQDELLSLKGKLDRTTTDLKAKRAQLASMKKDIQDKTTKLEDMRQYNGALEAKLQAVMEGVLSMEERATQMEQMHRDQEKHLKECDNQLQQKQKLLFAKKQELQTMRKQEKNLLADISSGRIALSNLNSRLQKLDQYALKHQEYINSQDFQIQLLEGKMARLSGNVNKEEKEALEKQASELNKTLEEKKKEAAMLSGQLKALQNDIRCVRKENEKTRTEKSDLTTKIDEMNLINDTLDKHLKKLRLKKKDSIVETNMLQLEVKRLRTLLYDKADGVLSLEQRKLQLQTAMKEWQEEMRVHEEMQSKQVKMTEQELQGIRAELHERFSKVDKMKTKYEIVTISMAPPEDEEDKSQAYYIIKAAQEKEELQRKGDDLDAKIRKAESENKAMENTMNLFNDHNSSCRRSLNKVAETSPEHNEKLKLEEQKRAADEKVRFLRRQMKELKENTEVINSSLSLLHQEEAAQAKSKADLQAQSVSLKKDLASQQEKLDRATKQSSKLAKELRSAKNTTEETFEERDIKRKELKDCKKAVNKLLLEVMEQQPGLQSTIHTYFMQASLAIPSDTPAQSSRSSKMSSGRSLGSFRSSKQSSVGSARASAVHSPAIKTLELDLGHRVSSTPSAQSPGSDGSRSALSSRGSRVHNL